MAAQAAPTDYHAIGQHIAQANGVPWPIFNAMIHQESGWNPAAVSPVGARGFGQLMPGTAAGLHVNPDDPVQNLQGAAKYLKMQFQKFGRWDLALAAYNAGAGAVSKYGGIPPYTETQNYVKNIMANAQHMAGGNIPGANTIPGANGVPVAPQAPPIGADLASMTKTLGLGGTASPLQNVLNFASPSDASVAQLGSLGGLAQKTAQASKAPIDPSQQIGLPQLGLAPPPGGASPLADAGAKVDPYAINAIPTTKYMNGRAPMVTGGNIAAKYPGLAAQSQVDWEHVNPRLLQVLSKQAQKHGIVIVLNSGYRDNAYSVAHGGFANDPHTHGTAVDAYVNGHPIGDVISPEEWAKLGVRSGNTPGFYKGKPDPEHLDLMGIPVKGGK